MSELPELDPEKALARITELLTIHRHKLVAPNKAVCGGCGHKCKYDEFPEHQAAVLLAEATVHVMNLWIETWNRAWGTS